MDYSRYLLSEGIFPELNNCLVCSNELTPFQYYLVFENGGLICSECMSATNNRILLSETEIRFLKYLSKMDNSRSDIGLCSDKKIFETGTSNIFLVRNNKLYSPAKNCYKGITYKFFESKIKKIIKKDIMIDTLSKYDEIILIGSGKGVASVKTVDKIGWKRKSLKIFNLLNNHYSVAAKKYPRY